jgi:AraC-like DNA-binding protein
VDELGKEMALALLRDRDVAVDEVTFLLGYAENATFQRAFRRWTGTTPRRFRATAS